MRPLIASLAASLYLGLAVSAHAKIPVPPSTPEQQAKAAEAKMKAAEAAKKEAEALGRAQDRAAENYKKGKGKSAATAAAPAKKQ